MEDRVAEVLAQRARLDRGAGGAFALSILLHGGATALAVYAALHQPPIQPAPVLNIQLRSLGGPTPITKPAPAPKPVAPRIEAPKPVPLTPPPPTTATTAPPKNVAPPSPFGQSTKKPSDVVPAPTPKPPASPAATSTAPAGATGAGAIDVPVGGTGVAGLEGADFPYAIYIDRMKTLVGGRWFRPQMAAGPTATVYFVIERDGKIRDARVETSSGNGTFDRAALRAVLESSPLPPLPFGYTGTYLGVHLTFK